MDAVADPQADTDRRPSIQADFARVRRFSERLTQPLSPEDMTVQSAVDASPTKWHLAHTSWFFETFVLKAHDKSYRPYDDRYEYLFNSYYNGVGPQFSRPDRGVLSRPTVDEIRAYRTHVDRAMDTFIDGCSTHIWTQVAPLIELGLHHEQQHQELMVTDIKHAFSYNPLHPAVYDAPRETAGPEARAEKTNQVWVDFDGGIREIGWSGAGFAFDNEGPTHDVLLRPYRLARRPVSNEDFISFIADGGYATARLWLSDGWANVRREGWTHPIYWHERDGIWHEYTLSGLRPLDLPAPAAHISFYEAAAYAEWAGARLPTEFEWENAARELPPEGHFAGEMDFHPRHRDDGASGLQQMFGGVWEWTQSAYAAYPGFRADAGTVGEYNGKFMVNQLVLRGGSCATPDGHIRASYRNFFYPHHRWQYSGLRLAEDL